MIVDDNNILFLRADGSPAEGAIYVGGEGPDGELFFFELIGNIHPRLSGEEKYRRLLIRRVFPYAQMQE